jgi:hypothetical protein
MSNHFSNSTAVHGAIYSSLSVSSETGSRVTGSSSGNNSFVFGLVQNFFLLSCIKSHQTRKLRIFGLNFLSSFFLIKLQENVSSENVYLRSMLTGVFVLGKTFQPSLMFTVKGQSLHKWSTFQDRGLG